ncbi:MAG: response regulator transcription factor [Bacteroidota bacterium]
MHIVIIEDDPELRADMAVFLRLEPSFRVSPFESIGAFINDYTTEDKIDLILLDVMLYEQNSLNHLFKIRRLIPQVKILIVTGSNTEAFLMKALSEGADGYYLKGSNLELLLGAIRAVSANQAYIDPAMTKFLFNYYKANVVEQKPVSPELSYMTREFDLNKRETEVLTGLMNGLRYKEIAERYHVSINTIRHYVLSLYRKTDVNNKKALLKKVRALA